MRFLLCLLLLSSAVSAQVISPFRDSAIVRTIDDLPAIQPFDTAHPYNLVASPYVYMTSDNDVYRLFGYDIYMKYYRFNFGDHHIFGTRKCRQCMQHCRHEEGQTSCHRNRCTLQWVWVVREDKKAFTGIPSSTIPGHSGEDLPANMKFLYRDTVINSIADTNMAKWYTHAGGDCFAKFKFGLFADKYHPVLLMKEWNYWGGCRAGGSWDYTISFRMPPGILHYTKNIILMEKYNGITD